MILPCIEEIHIEYVPFFMSFPIHLKNNARQDWIRKKPRLAAKLSDIPV